MQDDSIIKAVDLVLGYENHPVASNVNFEIKKGEFIGIFGPNGSGKSTLLRSLLGLIKPLAGTLWVLGLKPEHGNHLIGYMPQLRSFSSIANLTSRTMIEASINGTRYGMPFLHQQQKNEVQQVLELVKAESYADRGFHYLSGGERQRIFLAQALLGHPIILLLDEPLTNLDPHYQVTFIHLLSEIQQKLNVTILFTAHDPNPLLKVMNRVLYFAQGKAAIGEVDEVITSAKLTDLYGIPIEVIHYKEQLIVLGEKTLESHHD